MSRTAEAQGFRRLPSGSSNASVTDKIDLKRALTL